MKKEVLINLLENIRSAADTALILLEEQTEEKECEHPKDRREDISTMGNKRWKCKNCGHVEEVS